MSRVSRISRTTCKENIENEMQARYHCSPSNNGADNADLTDVEADVQLSRGGSLESHKPKS